MAECFRLGLSIIMEIQAVRHTGGMSRGTSARENYGQRRNCLRRPPTHSKCQLDPRLHEDCFAYGYGHLEVAAALFAALGPFNSKVNRTIDLLSVPQFGFAIISSVEPFKKKHPCLKGSAVISHLSTPLNASSCPSQSSSLGSSANPWRGTLAV
jgi:hypothetical protein